MRLKAACLLVLLALLSRAQEPRSDCLDLTGDLRVDVGDLLAILAAFGSVGTPEDIDGDGSVSVNDLLDLLGHFGQRCSNPSLDGQECQPTCSTNARCIGGTCSCEAGFRGTSCELSCDVAVSHGSDLVALESSLPCSDCLGQCFATLREPRWDDAVETCGFLDQLFSISDDGTVEHHDCINRCSHDKVAHAIELYLACHGGTTVAGGPEDTAATVRARGELVERISGLCFTLHKELGQAWHGQEETCVDEETDCPIWAAAGECTANFRYMAARCRLACGLCTVLDPSTHMCVTDAAVLDAVGAVPRHMFTPQDLDRWPTGAYRDYSQVIGFGATISTPHVQALMTQLLQLSGQGQDAKVLEIGTGSGYQTALLVQMGWDVYTIEIEPHLQERATMWLTDAGYMSTGRLHTRLGDGYLGWPAAARFNGIIVTCSPTHVPQPLKDQLALGGRLIIPVGPDLALSRLLVITRVSESSWEEEFLFTCRWVPLQGQCVVDHCESLGNESMPICRAERHAEEMANQPIWTGQGFASHDHDYFHATVVCTSDPCQSLECSGGHDTDPTCCVETVAGSPCEPIWRDDDGMLVDCSGSVQPCTTDSDCDDRSWCRSTEHVALELHGHGLVRKQCVPFVREGVACEGFGLPWFFERCDPSMELVCAIDHALPDLPGVCQSSAGCDESANYYQTCTSDTECRTGYSCSAPLDGCVPQDCDCNHQCSSGCRPGVGLCERMFGDCDPSDRDVCAQGRNCPDDEALVCGADGREYPNECLAECSCVEVASTGSCPSGSGR